jgi:hypothetical protein
MDEPITDRSERVKATDSARWCAKCEAHGDHHTDRCPTDRSEREHEPRVSEGTGSRDGGCNVYGCGHDGAGKVWKVDLGRTEIRLCRRHARDVRRQLPTR